MKISDAYVYLLMIVIPLGLFALRIVYFHYFESDQEAANQAPEQKRKPSWADDPVAQSIEWSGVSAWSPRPSGGRVQIDTATTSVIRFRPIRVTGVLKGIGAFVALFVVGFYFGTSSVVYPLAVAVLGTAFGLGLFLLYQRTSGEFTFDKAAGLYWSGRERPSGTVGCKTAIVCGKLSDIHALQLIHTYWTNGTPVSGSDYRTYNMCELNLVLKDGERQNVSTHDSYDLMFRDATTLSRFLTKPLWQFDQ